MRESGEAPARAGRVVGQPDRRLRRRDCRRGSTAPICHRSLAQRLASGMRSMTTATGNRNAGMAFSGYSRHDSREQQSYACVHRRAPSATIVDRTAALTAHLRIRSMATIIPLTDARALARRARRVARSAPGGHADRHARRHARPAAARPAHLGHRPLQLPLRLLHAEGRVRPRLPVPAARRAADVRGDRARSRASSSAHGVREDPPDRRRAAAAQATRAAGRDAGATSAASTSR